MEKYHQTCLERYNKKNFVESDKFKKQKNFYYIYDNIIFDSSWELALWIYAKDNDEDIEREPCSFPYTSDNKLHQYFPDFKYEGQLIEIKGDQFFDEDNNYYNPYSPTQQKSIDKYQCILTNHINLWKQKDAQFALDYVKEKYGKDYLKQFKNK